MLAEWLCWLLSVLFVYHRQSLVLRLLCRTSKDSLSALAEIVALLSVPASSARVTGDWVCLQNCHLAETFMPLLQQLSEDLHHEQVHPRFRLFLTSQPTNIIPTDLLKQSIKIITEPPSVGVP